MTPSSLTLLWPWWLSFRRRIQAGKGRERIRSLIFGGVGALFWGLTFWGFWRVLVYFRGIESIGDLLAAKLLSMIFLTFFALLIFSNVVTALSTYFLSQDLELLLAKPVGVSSIYLAKLVETLTSSSWMVLMFGTPVFLVYGIVFGAGPVYYLALLGALPPFLVIPAALGAAIIMGLTNVFPARRARDILILLTLLFGVGLYLLVRFLQPERLVDPEAFSGVLSYFASLTAPGHPLLPSQWMGQVVLPLLFPMGGDPLFFLGMLWSTALAFVVMGGWWTRAVYREGWSRSQEGRRARISRSPLVGALVGLLCLPFPGRMRPLVRKDALIFLRDPTQWSQLLLLGALVVVYLYNFSALPLDKAPIDSWYLQNILAFLNLGLAGFVVAAVAVRFVYPAVSLEGRAFWIIRSSPMSMRSFLWGKFWSSLFPLLVLAEFLVVASNWLLNVSPFMMGLSVGTIFLATFGITGLGVGMGALYPRFQVENVAHISSGFGGMLYMIMTIGFIGAVVILEALPVYVVLHSKFFRYSIQTWQYGAMGISFGLLLALMWAAFWIPMRRGLVALEVDPQY
jgi:ABC-2 type transport system permease protein